ncbi:Hepatic triacylglycerol lipase [Halotydeus destructor]|nr:Hepatic triacylglycerol lipase [Halotydeus destructor]
MMVPSISLALVSVFATYLSLVTSLAHEAPCTEWLESNFPNEVHTSVEGYYIFEQAEVPSRQYGDLGNFTGYEEPAYHLGLQPMDVDELQTSFSLLDGLATRRTEIQQPNQVAPFVRPEEYDKVYVLAHDFNQDPEEDRMFELAPGLLRYNVPADVARPRILVILVNWSHGSRAGLNGTFQRQAAVNTIIVGRQVGLLLDHIVVERVVPADRIHLIGEGMGAQVLHFAARWFTTRRFEELQDVIRVGRLTALDPTSAHFEGFRPLFGEWPHVSKLDATKVDVIITAGGNFNGLGSDPLNGLVGMGQSVGFKNFYVNGGQVQPYCIGVPEYEHQLYYDFCAHEMARDFFLYTLQPGAQRARLVARPGRSQADFLDEVARRVPWDKRKGSLLGMDAFAGPYNLDDDYYISVEVNDNELFDPDEEIVTDEEPKKEEDRLLKVPDVAHMPDTEEAFMESGARLAALSHKDLEFCGKFRQDPKLGQGGRIFRGQRPYPGQFPWVVCMVSYDDEYEDWVGGHCTGAILNDRWILIAAHCFPFPERVPFYVTYGTNDCLNLTLSHTFRRIVMATNRTVFIHPRFRMRDVYDVALIRLQEPIMDLPNEDQEYAGGLVNSVCFHTNQMYEREDDEVIYVPGFGTKGDEEVANVSKYRAVTISIVNSGLETCDFRYFNDFTGLGVGADMAVKVYHPDIYVWIDSTMQLYDGVLEIPEQHAEAALWRRPDFDP